MEIYVMGVAVGTNGGLMSMETLIDVNNRNNGNIKLFGSGQEVFEWLVSLN